MGQFLPVGFPIAQGAAVVVPFPEPTIVQDEAFHSQGGRFAGQGAELGFVEIEICGFPIVVDDGPRDADMGFGEEAGADEAMEGGGHLRFAIPMGQNSKRGGEALPRGEGVKEILRVDAAGNAGEAHRRGLQDFFVIPRVKEVEAVAFPALGLDVKEGVVQIRGGSGAGMEGGDRRGQGDAFFVEFVDPPAAEDMQNKRWVKQRKGEGREAPDALGEGPFVDDFRIPA